MRTFLITIFLTGFFATLHQSCKHEPLIPVDNNPIDPIDTTQNPIDTIATGIPCSPDTIYFQNTILPMLIANCTQSGCHNAIDHKKDVILTSYETLINTVENVTSNDWNENELMEVILDNDPDKRMPPAPNPKLTLQQIDKIAKWIAQGTKNNACNEDYGVCDTVGVTYMNHIKPLIQAKCQGCHLSTAPQGNVDLSSYAKVKTYALNGKFYNSLIRNSNWMPQGGAKTDNCGLAKIRTWIADGVPE
jgi:hypothetical protein